MRNKPHFIGGDWCEGKSKSFSSINPATGETLWKGNGASQEEVDAAVSAARNSLPYWRSLGFQKRCEEIEKFKKKLIKDQSTFAEIISQETGKPLWEAKQEIQTMVLKIDISIQAFLERCPEKEIDTPKAHLKLHHKPQGVVAIFGPFNFPGHLPNAHLVPALIAGNTVVFKGSELTPLVSEWLAHFYEPFPPGVVNLIQGGPKTGHDLIHHPHLNGLFFTGSHATGQIIMDAFKRNPEKILALEMGGNNPLIVWDTMHLDAAAYLTIQSAFLTSGQRCTCARRLILPKGERGDRFINKLITLASSICVGAYTETPEPFMGPVISLPAAEKLLDAQKKLVAEGGEILLEMRQLLDNSPFLTPGILDATEISQKNDEELFGPFLQIIRVSNFETAIHEANQTQYGLVASLLSDSSEKFEQFYQEIRAGVINWNTPTTGASSRLPFGGIGKSGNHHPSGFYAADYCSYPVASMINKEIHLPNQLAPGLRLKDLDEGD